MMNASTSMRLPFYTESANSITTPKKPITPPAMPNTTDDRLRRKAKNQVTTASTAMIGANSIFKRNHMGFSYVRLDNISIPGSVALCKDVAGHKNSGGDLR